jgi:biotin synthase-related radical SAM superfamily protein
MNWPNLKARLLEAGTVRLTGEPVGRSLERSRAGPGAGGAGSVFFAVGGHRVRLAVADESPVVITHLGAGIADLRIGEETIRGRIEEVGCHCPRQAYITVSAGCIFRCRYCPVPFQETWVKTPDEVAALVAGVIDRIDGIALTSGVVGSAEEEEERVIAVIERLSGFQKPIGVSIYPRRGTASRLHALGVAEVKFNLEAATPGLFAAVCPGLDRDLIWDALAGSVVLFGKNHVFSNVILGLGETDEEMEACIRRLTGMGVIPVIRPLTPAAEMADERRPDARRLLRICGIHRAALADAGLDPCRALTMCTACTGCDLVPGRDL